MGPGVILEVHFNILGRHIMPVLITNEEWDVLTADIELAAVRDRGDGMIGG